METNGDDDLTYLTKREHFALEFANGFISSCDWRGCQANELHAEDTAKFSVMYADALINALNKK